MIVSADEGLAVRDLSLSTHSAGTMTAFDSLKRAAAARGRDGARDELQLTGSAELAGTVRGLFGQPISGATVRVRDARSTTVVDRSGSFLLTGLPAGTHVLVVRHPGYSMAEHYVELRPGKRAHQTVLMVRPPPPDPAIPETLTEYAAFAANRRTNPFGQFLTVEQIDQKRSAAETADLFDDVLGFTAFGHGDGARVISNAALANGARCSSAHVVIEGEEGHRINDLTPGRIGGIEAYSDPEFVPARFAGRAECGVIVIWLRKSPRPASRPMGKLRENGYP
jgi:hypothetical protein